MSKLLFAFAWIGPSAFGALVAVGEEETEKDDYEQDYYETDDYHVAAPIGGTVQIKNAGSETIEGFTVMHHRFDNAPFPTRTYQNGSLKASGPWDGWVSPALKFQSESWSLRGDWWGLTWRYKGDCALYRTAPDNGIEQFFKNPDNWRTALSGVTKVAGLFVGGIPTLILTGIELGVDAYCDANGIEKNNEEESTEGLFSYEIKKESSNVQMTIVARGKEEGKGGSEKIKGDRHVLITGDAGEKRIKAVRVELEKKDCPN